MDRKGPIIFDSGVRRGHDVFKALASGTDIVGPGGRPISGWHSAAGKACSLCFGFRWARCCLESVSTDRSIAGR
ncbi:alpha-hydroxy-acid oxidizing protein [Rhizobium tibeticum]|uniref:alpha-hydroxy-acid oxidizing protein n=1 Tax=Rhizobium tibeticum TaxID=501024 RepID=UPI001FCD096F